MMFLTISIRTIKGIKGAGVPSGTRCARKFMVLLMILKIMNPNHRGKASDKVIARCLVAVKEKETNPKVLLKIIKAKREMKIRMFSLEFLRSTENSRVIALNISFAIKLKGEAFIQNEGIRRIENIIKLIQFNDKLKDEEGSKIEKRLFIIFKYVIFA
jgi:anthranilate phosphoribosyltransferase